MNKPIVFRIVKTFIALLFVVVIFIIELTKLIEGFYSELYFQFTYVAVIVFLITYFIEMSVINFSALKRMKKYKEKEARAMLNYQEINQKRDEIIKSKEKFQKENDMDNCLTIPYQDVNKESPILFIVNGKVPIDYPRNYSNPISYQTFIRGVKDKLAMNEGIFWAWQDDQYYIIIYPKVTYAASMAPNKYVYPILSKQFPPKNVNEVLRIRYSTADIYDPIKWDLYCYDKKTEEWILVLR